MANLHNSQTYNTTGCRRLPETFDVDFINYIGSYLDHSLKSVEQDWNEIEMNVHADFDLKFGRDFVTRHITEFKR